MSVKLYFDKEIRRFPLGSVVGKDQSVTFTALYNKIKNLFPNVAGPKICWKDSENDYVTIACDEDLHESRRNMADELLRIYLFADENEEKLAPSQEKLAESQEKLPESQEKTQTEQKPSENLHKGIVCDACERLVNGKRFKCIMCPDFDLCETCESKGFHKDHVMLRITNPGDGAWKFLFKNAHIFSSLLEHARGIVANEDYLKKVGDALATALKSLGIDVSYEVHSPTPTNNSRDQQQAPESEPADQKLEPENQDTVPLPQQPTVEENVGVAVAAAAAGDSPKKTEENNVEWEILDKPKEEQNATVTLSTGMEKIIDEALSLMMAMGFNNDGGWLKNLLMQKNADISAVLDVLQPVFKKN